uniref:Periplasmic protease n=1 Tax=uncultured gamma proteobacterium HF0500_07A21 TaxID=723573 RepID=E7C4U0_9GAMM|nr:periplasmic protease [uncultured gamma proteobacterium HF0500_07A21]
MIKSTDCRSNQTTKVPIGRARRWCWSHLLAISLTLPCVSTYAEIAPLRALPGHQRAVELINYFIQRYHYRTAQLNDDLSSQILDRYIETLDANRSYFLATDIERFEQMRFHVDDYLRKQELDHIFELFDLYRERAIDRAEFSMRILSEGFDLNIPESFRFNRSSSPWPTDQAQLDDIWRRRVKNDYLSLKLAGQAHDDILKTLGDRYRQLSRRTKQITSTDVFETFINAYITSVEPHTSYFSPRSTENFKIRMSLSLEGIGAVLQTENEYTVVRRIVAGGPAELSQLLNAGDRIISVGQNEDRPLVDVIGWRLDDVVDLIRGPKSTVVRLEILPLQKGPDASGRIISIVRDTIRLEEQAAQKSVISVDRGDHVYRIGVIDLPTFYVDFDGRSSGQADYRSTTRDVARLVKELQTENIDGLIIDLRGNGGGALTEATTLTGLFIEQGPIVQVKDAKGRVRVKHDSDPTIVYRGPLAVLVDGNSASASEIFAGAIQDYGRGIVIGEPTYGKGTVQNLVDLDRYARNKDEKLGQLKFTIAQFFRINGDSTQHKGVVPDILLPTARDDTERGERGLANALPWQQVDSARYSPFDQSDLSAALSNIRSLHQTRVADDPGFEFLLSNQTLDNEIAALEEVSLLESKRQIERAQRQSVRDSLTTTLRKAWNLGEDEKASGEEFPGDIVLNETTQILTDTMLELRHNRMLAQHSAHSSAESDSSKQDQ